MLLQLASDEPASNLPQTLASRVTPRPPPTSQAARAICHKSPRGSIPRAANGRTHGGTLGVRQDAPANQQGAHLCRQEKGATLPPDCLQIASRLPASWMSSCHAHLSTSTLIAEIASLQAAEIRPARVTATHGLPPLVSRGYRPPGLDPPGGAVRLLPRLPLPLPREPPFLASICPAPVGKSVEIGQACRPRSQ